MRIGGFDRADNIVVFDDGTSDVFAEGLAGDGDATEVERAGLFADGLEDGRNAAGAVDIFHVILARGGDFTDMGDALGNFVEMLDAEGDARFDGQRQGVEDRVGRSAHGHIEGDGIFKRGAGEDVPRLDVFLDHVHDGPAGRFKEAVAGVIDGENGAVAWQGQTEGFAEAVHRVGGEHAGA